MTYHRIIVDHVGNRDKRVGNTSPNSFFRRQIWLLMKSKWKHRVSTWRQRSAEDWEVLQTADGFTWIVIYSNVSKQYCVLPLHLMEGLLLIWHGSTHALQDVAGSMDEENGEHGSQHDACAVGCRAALWKREWLSPQSSIPWQVWIDWPRWGMGR